MTVAGALRNSWKRVRPSHLLDGLAIALLGLSWVLFLWVGLDLALPGLFFESVFPPVFLPWEVMGDLQIVLFSGGLLLGFVCLTPVSAVLYETVFEEQSGGRRPHVQVLRRWYWPLLKTNSAAVGATLGITAVVIGGWFTLDTAIRFVQYTTGGAPELGVFGWRPPALLIALLIVFLVGSLMAFADVLVMVLDVRPRRAWWASLVAATRRPVAVAGHAALGVALVSLTIGGFLFSWISPLVGIPVTVVALGSAITLCGRAHATLATETVVPAVGSVERRPDLPVRSIVGIVLAVVVLVGASGAVRAADLGISQDEATSLPEDPAAAYSGAVNNTAGASRQVAYSERNGSNGWTLVARFGVDPAGHQWYSYDIVHSRRGVTAIGGYAAEGVVARRTGPAPNTSLAAVRRSGQWLVDPVPRKLMPNSDSSMVLDSDASLPLQAANDTHLTYRTDDPDRIDRAFDRPIRTGFPPATAVRNPTLTVVIDRERGVLDTVTYQYGSESQTAGRRIAFHGVGTAEVTRPLAIGPRAPVEWVWDALVY